jgi:uracil phosphoribosyltransferase
MVTPHTLTTELQHRYGSHVHIINNPTLNGWLRKLCEPTCEQPGANRYVELLYTNLIQAVVARELQTVERVSKTRMHKKHGEISAQLTCTEINPEQRAVVVNLARAGTWPSHICYSLLNEILVPALVRQDHILASRMTDLDQHVNGTHLTGAKIGGGIDGAVVMFPDPMGATGSTLVSAIDHYKKISGGSAKRFVAMHLIVTPEYIKNVLTQHPEARIYALRVDRGLSPDYVLESVPGTFWSDERGLNDVQYIVPGAGGLGEVLNNSWV